MPASTATWVRRAHGLNVFILLCEFLAPVLFSEVDAEKSSSANVIESEGISPCHLFSRPTSP